MSKKECMIIRDLFPNYVEELISVETNEFIQDHINNCSECREILKSIQNERNEKNYLRKNNEKIEYNHLKKYNKKMLILKSIILIIIWICLILTGNFLLKIYRINNVIQTSNNSVQELKKLDNYKLEVQYHKIDYSDKTESNINDLYYLYNNKYKEVTCNNLLENNTQSYYGEINSNKRIEIYDADKKIIHSTVNYNYAPEGNFIKIEYNDISSSARLRGVWSIWRNAKVKIRNDRFNGKSCYVLRYQDIKDEYKEIWIEKNTMLPIRIVQDVFDHYYDEKIINLNIDVVTNSDVEVPVKEGYSIEESITELSDENLKIMEEVLNKF